MNEFLDMGGYGAFVWPSYAITALVMVGVFVSSYRFLKSRERELDALQVSLGQVSLGQISLGQKSPGEDKKGVAS